MPKRFFKSSNAGRPGDSWIRQRDVAGGADRQRRQTMRVQIEEAVRELPAAAVAEQGETVAGERPDFSGLIDHVEQKQVEPYPVAIDPLVAVNVVCGGGTDREQGRQKHGARAFGKFAEPVAEAVLPGGAVDQDKHG